eukprot:TRINITY_DN2405_c0_g3_i2.p1 TRINITY_DN2405_c0_g3~~TRINITY_DN2405_c0_g3_i2.p1  ORF type:complete len:536 (-),score=95.94 TRINITY_DN2405_c0_g3_i2:362-1819(-)
MNLRDERFGEGLLHRACFTGQLEVVDFLISENFDVNEKGNNLGSIPLHSAAAGGHIEITRLLIQHGAEVNAQTTNGITPLYSAALRDHLDLVKVLIENGADPDIGFNGDRKQVSPSRSLEMYLLLNSKNKPLLEIQIVSDVHTEFVRDLTDIHEMMNMKPVAPYLALLGDVGIYTSVTYEPFLAHCSKNFEHVFVLAGNHEYYGTEVHGAKQKYVEICSRFPNVEWMDRKAVVVNGVKIIGCTLWSYVQEKNRLAVKQGLNDYNRICVCVETEEALENAEQYMNDDENGDPGKKEMEDGVHVQGSDERGKGKERESQKGNNGKVEPMSDEDEKSRGHVKQFKNRILTVEDTVKWHERDRKFIEKEITKSQAINQPVVVLTHHAPTFQNSSAPQFEGSPTNEAFATNLHSLMGGVVKYWAFGHTHWSSCQLISDTFVLSNQFGYLFNFSSNTRYKNEVFHEISDLKLFRNFFFLRCSPHLGGHQSV